MLAVSPNQSLLGEWSYDSVFLLPVPWVHQQTGLKDVLTYGRSVAANVANNPEMGGCMSLTIQPGSAVYLDRGPSLVQPEPVSSQIYAIRTNHGLAIKRVWITGEMPNCLCDNRSKPPLVIKINNSHAAAWHIAARVTRIVNAAT